MTETERAELHRQQCANRAAWRAAIATRLAGAPAAAARITAAFEPLRPQPGDARDCPDPPAPQRPGWVGRVPGDIQLPEYLR